MTISDLLSDDADGLSSFSPAEPFSEGGQDAAGDWLDQARASPNFGRYELVFDEAAGEYILRDLHAERDAQVSGSEDVLDAAFEVVDAEPLLPAPAHLGPEPRDTTQLGATQLGAPWGIDLFPGRAAGNAFHDVLGLEAVPAGFADDAGASLDDGLFGFAWRVASVGAEPGLTL